MCRHQQHDRAGQAATAPVGMNPPARLPVIANLLSPCYQGYRQIDSGFFFLDPLQEKYWNQDDQGLGHGAFWCFCLNFEILSHLLGTIRRSQDLVNTAPIEY